MKHIVRVGLASLLLGVAGAAQAAFIEYTPTHQGGDLWRYDYTVGQELGESFSIDEFTVYFDLGLFSDLLVFATPTGWDGLAVQPDPLLPDDGFVDWAALSGGIAPGSSLGGFSVLFTWMGTGAPGSQPFDIIDFSSFATLFSGNTLLASVEPPPQLVPEPGTLALLGLGLAGLGLARRRGTN